MMNKQEAIERIESRAFNIGDTDLVVGLSYTKNIINQINEPKKVVVPKLVAEWYERNKDGLDPAIYSTITGTYRKLDGENNDLLGTFEGWLLYEYNSILTLVHMHLFGYEIEQEPLYMVEIADAILTKITRGRNVQYKMLPSKDVSDVFDKGIYATGLTEQEIKQKDERLWQFAESVKLNWSKSPEDIQANIDTKADQQLTQQQLNLLVEKAQLMQTELEAKVAMETLSDLERAYKAYVEANDKAVAKSQADLIEAGRRVDAMVETLEVGNDIEV